MLDCLHDFPHYYREVKLALDCFHESHSTDLEFHLRSSLCYLMDSWIIDLLYRSVRVSCEYCNIAKRAAEVSLTLLCLPCSSRDLRAKRIVPFGDFEGDKGSCKRKEPTCFGKLRDRRRKVVHFLSPPSDMVNLSNTDSLVVVEDL